MWRRSCRRLRRRGGGPATAYACSSRLSSSPPSSSSSSPRLAPPRPSSRRLSPGTTRPDLLYRILLYCSLKLYPPSHALGFLQGALAVGVAGHLGAAAGGGVAAVRVVAAEGNARSGVEERLHPDRLLRRAQPAAA